LTRFAAGRLSLEQWPDFEVRGDDLSPS